MTTIKTRRGMINAFGAFPEKIHEYFEHFPGLTENYPWDVVIAYLHSRVELAHNMIVYCGVVKCHKVDAELARKAINSQHMTRKQFQELYTAIFDAKIPAGISKHLSHAEKARDRILHGKQVSDADQREAVYNLLIYAKKLNKKLQDTAGFQPFGSLQGFKGKAKSLDRATSRWVLKGIGFSEFQ